MVFYIASLLLVAAGQRARGTRCGVSDVLCNRVSVSRRQHVMSIHVEHTASIADALSCALRSIAQAASGAGYGVSDCVCDALGDVSAGLGRYAYSEACDA